MPKKTRFRLQYHNRTKVLLTYLLAWGLAIAVPVAAPIIPWAKGVLVLLPFVEPVDATELAIAIERSLDGVLARPTSVAASQILDPAQRGILRSLPSS